MKSSCRFIVWICVFLIIALGPPPVAAAPDDYVGDSAIFGGATAAVRPNVLIILDTSGSMNDQIEVTLKDKGEIDTYDPSTNYRDTDSCGSDRNDACRRNTIYKCWQWDGSRCDEWRSTNATLNSLENSCGNGPGALSSEGIWQTSQYDIDGQGNCSLNDWVNNTYATGNYINWQRGGGASEDNVVRMAKIDIAKSVLSDLISNTTGVDFGLMKFHYKHNSPREVDVAKGGEFVSDAGYITTIRDMDATHVPPLTNREKFLDVIGRITAEGWTPLAESLYEAGRYFRGEPSAFHDKISYTSPISARCQANYVIVVTDGMSRHDRHPVLAENIGDQDNDGFEPRNDPDKDYGFYWTEELYGSDYLDDVAKYLFENDHSELPGTQNIITYTVGFGEVGADAGAVKLLNETIFHGTGGALSQAYLAMDMTDLKKALGDILTDIKKANTAFAAPVVPVAPQNRNASGQRVYFGLFQPTDDGRWHGNLKKYGINQDGLLLESDDRTVAVDADGRIRDKATSFWSPSADGREVVEGGAGHLLTMRELTSSHPVDGRRQIFTNLGDSPLLTDAANAFEVGNPNLREELSALGDAEFSNLIRFVHGVDVFDDDDDGQISDNRLWILGDILHASPAVVHYHDYEFSSATEADPSINKSIIFVAANDGQLHAFRDADGKELWSFLPDILLPDLKNLRDGHHTYLVDMAPSVFVFDPDKDGPSDSRDKVVLLFGLRRGGGKDVLLQDQSRGAYYALDVSAPEAPRLLWKLTRDDSGFDELGETWSRPSLVRMRVAKDFVTRDLLVAVFGAGYDNNEDLRFGSTQGFPIVDDDTDTTLPTGDAGNVTSSADGAQHNPRGRGVFAVNVGEFSSQEGVPVFSPAGTVEKIWSHTFADDENMTFGIPSEVAALDVNHDGYVDRFYVGDTGGFLWRVGALGTNPDDWRIDRIFDANIDAQGAYASDVGRKFFHRPSVTVERNGRATIFIGSGDQAHPLNEGVVDRLYAIKDSVPSVPEEERSYILNESDLVDVTENLLQEDDPGEPVSDILTALYQKDGWFIRLGENDGEKVLSSPLVFNRVAYFTTFASEAPVADDPCDSGNLGVSRVYAVDYLTGEAVFNYDPDNDDQDTANNDRALNSAGGVLRRSDRVKTLGSGIPTGARVLITESGEAKVLIGTDGGLQIEDTLPGGGLIPLYWRQR
jgi:type IV pilus assembly protein PilY1